MPWEPGFCTKVSFDEVKQEYGKSEQIRWLRRFYKRRNEALHTGCFHQDDLDARNLLELVDLMIHRTIRHLDPWHCGTNTGTCLTVEEALEEHED